MDLSNKLFSYPILNSETDDYPESRFDISLSVEESGKREVDFTVKIDLKDQKLEELIESGKAEFVTHFESTITSFRKAFFFSEREFKKKISKELLKDYIEVSSYIIAREEITGYNNPNFNPDYSGLSFDFTRGDILAIGSTFRIPMETDIGDIRKLPSIFSVSRAENFEGSKFEYNLDEDKIIIILSEELFSDYSQYTRLPSLNPLMHSLLITPALQFVFDYLETKGSEDYEEKRWFQVLKSALEKLHPGMDLEDILERYPSYQLAQLVMNNPLGKSFITINDLCEEGS